MMRMRRYLWLVSIIYRRRFFEFEVFHLIYQAGGYPGLHKSQEHFSPHSLERVPDFLFRGYRMPEELSAGSGTFMTPEGYCNHLSHSELSRISSDYVP